MNLTAVSIGIVTIAFLIYLYVTSAAFIEKKLSQSRQILFNRFLGLLLFGLLPLWLVSGVFDMSPEKLGLSFHIEKGKIFWLFILIPIPVLVNFFAAKSADNLAMYPQIRAQKWDIALIIVSALSWMMYLLGYEIMLRGVLFYSCLQEMTLLPAIIINTSIYALIHIPKGMKETVGSIPMGIILCLLTFYTGSIWAAFFVHCSLALSNEWFSLHYSREMELERAR